MFDPDLGLVVDLETCEDAHAQERTLVPAVLERVQAGDLWMGDRNFCTRAILTAFVARGAALLIREHGASPNPTPVGRRRHVGRGETGVVYEQAVAIETEAGEMLALRRIELELDQPTEDGDTLIRLLTNLPAERFDAAEVARLYRRRWSIEGLFQKLEAVLKSEVNERDHETRGAYFREQRGTQRVSSPHLRDRPHPGEANEGGLRPGVRACGDAPQRTRKYVFMPSVQCFVQLCEIA